MSEVEFCKTTWVNLLLLFSLQSYMYVIVFFFHWCLMHCINEMKCTCMLTLMIIAGPPEKEKYFHKIEEDGLPIHHDKDGSARKAYMNEHENWGKAAVSIFSSAVFQ